ncbi:MAG: transglutaminase domain-containing protein [Syntrophales bacterium]
MSRGAGAWRWRIAGAGTILLFCLLVAFRLGIAERLFSNPVSAVVPSAPDRAAGEAWLNILQGGRKIGYARRSVTPADSGFGFSEELFMKINTLGVVQPLIVRTEAGLTADRRLRDFRFTLGSNLFRFTARGSLAGKRLTVRVGEPGEETERVVDLAEVPYLGGGILESVGTAGLKPGESTTVSVFDPASLGQRPVRITFLGEEQLRVMGSERTARKLSVELLGVKQFAWVGADGGLLREEGLLGIVLERATREEALRGLEGALSADLTEIAAVAASKPIEAPLSLRMLRVRLKGVEAVQLALEGGRQEYENGTLTIRREPSAGRIMSAGGDGGDVSRYLEPTPLIQADHPKLREKAAAIVSPEDSAEVKAAKLVAWVHGNLKKSPVLSVPNALETLENLTGDCNEHAALLAGLARAAGLPAEVEAGVVYLRGKFFYHAWNVIYLRNRGGWMTADAVLGQMPADVTHIRFVRGEADRQLDLVGLIGRLELDILEMRE